MASGSETRQRKKVLLIRLTEAEQAQLVEAADRAGLTLASYARKMLLSAPPPRQGRRPPADKVELGRIVAHLGKIGGNLNQLARAANTGVAVDGVALAEEMGELAVTRALLRAALGRSAEKAFAAPPDPAEGAPP